jgi:hypothetical protein
MWFECEYVIKKRTEKVVERKERKCDEIEGMTKANGRGDGADRRREN